ncbi:hypothetical protein [Bradyrhizobium sp.]|uniref:hypothetical protein n=1 Tax=Bradyrhizobium sp. TaxID=376 RepID=UPI0040384A8A
MPLHRDIFWIGRQWAVTGFGMQAINQKHGGEFDIPIERLWDDDLIDILRGQKWFNPDDFDKGLAVARARHPQPQRPAAPLPVERLLQASAPRAVPQPSASPVIPAVEAPPIAAMEAAPEPVDSPKPAPSFPEMRILSHSAKLLRVWRALRRR